jgi:hypothetical protein
MLRMLLGNDTSSQAHHLGIGQKYTLLGVCPKSMAAKNILAKIVQISSSGFIEPPK